MAPIRLGMIGLSPSGYWAASAHLPYITAHPEKYTITALCNSSVEAALRARSHFKLPSSVAAYGSSADIAADPNVDMVVCSTRVDKHYDAIKPAIEKGKDVYCEWPLGKNLAEAEELTALAKSKGTKTIVGLQERCAPIVRSLKKVIDRGDIGKVLSTTIVSCAGVGGPKMSERVDYFNDEATGGDLVSIGLGHVLEQTVLVLGEIADVNAIGGTTYPTVDITNDKGEIVRTSKRSTPDNVVLAGKLKSGTILSIHIRGAAPFKGQPSLEWRILGEKGELRVESDRAFPVLELEGNEVRVKKHDFATDRVEDVTLEEVTKKELPSVARNIGMIYEAFAGGDKEGWADWGVALERHRVLDQVRQGCK